jgi:hypothetical protein
VPAPAIRSDTAQPLPSQLGSRVPAGAAGGERAAPVRTAGTEGRHLPPFSVTPRRTVHPHAFVVVLTLPQPLACTCGDFAIGPTIVSSRKRKPRTFLGSLSREVVTAQHKRAEVLQHLLLPSISKAAGSASARIRAQCVQFHLSTRLREELPKLLYSPLVPDCGSRSARRAGCSSSSMPQ